MLRRSMSRCKSARNPLLEKEKRARAGGTAPEQPGRPSIKEPRSRSFIGYSSCSRALLDTRRHRIHVCFKQGGVARAYAHAHTPTHTPTEHAPPAPAPAETGKKRCSNSLLDVPCGDNSPGLPRSESLLDEAVQRECLGWSAR